AMGIIMAVVIRAVIIRLVITAAVITAAVISPAVVAVVVDDAAADAGKNEREQRKGKDKFPKIALFHTTSSPVGAQVFNRATVMPKKIARNSSNYDSSGMTHRVKM